MSIVLKRLFKFFDEHPVVNNVSLEVGDGELFVLLGPSGSGKSTVLRMIAGLLSVDGGRVLLHGRDVTNLRPQRRGVGLVFQHYALFPHMTVASNVEFALKIRGVSASDRKARRDELLELVSLSGLEDRFPDQLSGGQQQRVALARALAHRPEVLLLDEPFGALDAKIRTDLRRSFREIQRKLGVATIFVTHDQEEGFELADRLGVMDYGRILEVGPPTELYFRPQTEFVATFLGRANLMVGECGRAGVSLGKVSIPLDGHVTAMGEGRRVQVLFRPEDVAVERSPGDLICPALGRAIVEGTIFSGSIETLRLRLPSLAGVRTIAPGTPFGAESVVVDALRSQQQARRFPLSPGDVAWIGVQRIHALPHPGLSFLLVDDKTDDGCVLAFGAQVARLARARVTVLALGPRYEERLQRARDLMGNSPAKLHTLGFTEDDRGAILREAELRHYDLVVHSRSRHGGTEIVERILEIGDHHLILVPRQSSAPKRVLVCVAAGEPGKEDVQFAGRLVRHLDATATILTVRPLRCSAEAVQQGKRFLEAGARTLALFGVEAPTVIRRGNTQTEILSEIKEGQHDLVVLGAPPPDARGLFTLGPRLRSLLNEMPEIPVLIVRSRLRHPNERSIPARRPALGTG